MATWKFGHIYISERRLAKKSTGQERGFTTTIQHLESKGRILTIEHPTESSPALTVFSGNAGQLLRGDTPTIHVLQAMRQRAYRNGVPFVIHLQEAGAVHKNSVGMTKLLEDIFGDEVTFFCYGPQESEGQIRQGHDHYLVSSMDLQVRARSVLLLPVVERNILRRNQRAAVNTSYDFPLPNGELGYLQTAGFHYDLGLTSKSKRISLLQAEATRKGVEQLLQQESDLEHQHQDQVANSSIRGLKGLITFSGDGNTRGFVGTRWQLDRVDSLKQGLGEEVKEATKEISVTANLSHSIQQEFLEKKHPFIKLAGRIVDDVLATVDDITGSKWGERKLDHQFYRDFIVTDEGSCVPFHGFKVIENNVFYNFKNADHYFISTLFGYQERGEATSGTLLT